MVCRGADRLACENRGGRDEPMTHQNQPRTVRLLAAMSGGAAIGVFAIGGLVFLGWFFDIAILKSLHPNLVSMKANTAVAFILTGISLWLLQPNRARFQPGRFIACAIAVIVATLGLLTLAEYVFGCDFGIDQRLFTEPAGTVQTTSPGRMAPNTALNFLLIGLSLLLLDVQTRADSARPGI